MALARSDQDSKALVVRSIDPVTGTPQNMGIELPPSVGGSGAVVVRWDLAHGRLLTLAHHAGSSAGLLDYWLVQLQAPAGAE